MLAWQTCRSFLDLRAVRRVHSMGCSLTRAVYLPRKETETKMKRLSHLSTVTSIVVILGLMIEAALAQGQCYSYWAKPLTVATGWVANCDRVFLTTDGAR